MSKIIQSGRFLSNMMTNLGKKKALMDLAVPLTKDFSPKLANKVTLPLIYKFERKK